MSFEVGDLVVNTDAYKVDKLDIITPDPEADEGSPAWLAYNTVLIRVCLACHSLDHHSCYGVGCECACDKG